MVCANRKQNQARLNFAEVQPKLNNKVVTAHRSKLKAHRSKPLQRNSLNERCLIPSSSLDVKNGVALITYLGCCHESFSMGRTLVPL